MEPLIIYFPVTCNILTPGHIQCLEYLSSRGEVIVGLLTTQALRGYKEERMSFWDRHYILQTLSKVFPNVRVIPQNTLNPEVNAMHYGCNAIASGDGFNDEEKKAIAELGLQEIHIRLLDEVDGKKKYASSSVI